MLRLYNNNNDNENDDGDDIRPTRPEPATDRAPMNDDPPTMTPAADKRAPDDDSNGMETATGYKETEVETIPENWDVVQLGELMNFRNGVNADASAYGKGTPFINVLEVITRTHLRSEDVPGQVQVEPSVISTYAVERGDVLFNRTSETQEEVGLASVYLDDDTVIFGGFVIRGRKQSDALDTVFSGYALRSHAVRKQIISQGQGAVRANISQQELSQVTVPLPPLHEQRAIAAALSDVDALIEKLDALIAKKRAVKTGAMQQLLTGEKRLPGFSGAWETKRLGEVTDIVSGGTPKSSNASYWNGNIPWCTPTDITSRRGKYLVETDRQITEEGLENSSAHLLPAETLLLCSRATIGEVKIATRPIATNQGFKSLICGSKVENEFLYYLLLTMTPDMEEKAYGSTFLELSRKAAASLELTLPPLEEQRAIAEVLAAMDAEIEALAARRAKTQAVKQGMMQELLTGKTRLV